MLRDQLRESLKLAMKAKDQRAVSTASPQGPIARLGVYCLAGADFPSYFRILRNGLQRAEISEKSAVAANRRWV